MDGRPGLHTRAASGADYRAATAQLGITRAVVVQPSVYGKDNRRTLDAVSELGRADTRAVAVVDGQTATQELEHLRDAGVRGIRFNQVHGGGPPLDQLRALANTAADLNWHLQMNAPASELLEIGTVLSSLPAPVVLDHLGRPGPGLAELSGLLRLLERPNVWVKLCWYRSSAGGTPYTDMQPAVQAMTRTAGDRCIWGSDWPHVNLAGRPRPDTGGLLMLVREWIGDGALCDRVLRRNAEILYGFRND